MENRVCIFVDGENLRYSVNKLFSPKFFDHNQYVPISARWDDWFDELASKAVAGPPWRRVRTYWFVISHVRCFPPLIHPEMSDKERLSWYGRNLDRISFETKREFEAASESEQKEILDEITRNLKARKGWVEGMFKTNHHRQNQIAENNRAIEFCRSGEITYRLFEKKFGQEKTVDVNLALAMVLRAPIYDTAVIVSGDQDYVPAVQQVKNLGKHVVNVSFEAEDGRLLPGGAKKLNEVTDWSLQIPFTKFQTALGLTEEIPQEEQ